MKILFIENRYRTVFWRLMAGFLIEEGHTVAFITQNKIFRSLGFKEYVIPYPKRTSNGSEEASARYSEIIKSDRNINYFRHRGIDHYGYYSSEIEKILEDFIPDIVFGESTAFHELITIELCKERGIMYLHPSTVRYPVGRFSFYQYDTLTPYKGSLECVDPSHADDIIQSICKRNVIPDYMRKPKVSLKSKIDRMKELLSLTASYYEGEHFNTPSPFIKRKIEVVRNKLKEKWDLLASSQGYTTSKTGFKILYPMHMQPEANLDVWGRQYRNQLDTLRTLVEHTEDDVEIVVKPNPKSKYELTDELLSFIQKNDRCRFVAHDVSMAKVLSEVDAVITVTGTIAIECVLANKPVLTLVKTINNTNANCIYLDSISGIGTWINRIKDDEFPRIDEGNKRDFINLLMKTSYMGKPYPNYTDDENLDNCRKAFIDVITKYAAEKQHNK